MGAPGEDLFALNGKIMYGKIRKRWQCLMCNFERGRYGRYQVFGHVASTRCYSTAKRNARRIIPYGEKHKEGEIETLPRNIDSSTAQDINYENIEPNVINDNIIYKCKRCTEFKSENPISVRNHLPRAHKRCPAGRAICHIALQSMEEWAN